jgi:rhodanese-related sulfurtransferase
MNRFLKLMEASIKDIKELMPWDLEERLAENPDLVIVDVREPEEYAAMHIPHSISAPRGILESCVDWDYDDTIPELVRSRDKEVVVVCRSGNRSLMAAFSMIVLGYKNVASLKTGLRGWNDYEQPLIDQTGKEVDIDDAEEYFTSVVRDDQRMPADWAGY